MLTGFAQHPLYASWHQMLRRCYKPSNPKYPRYGARGITVCDEWRHSFLTFLADMGPRPEGKSLDRLDNDGPYAPWNCRWATPKQQARNSSKMRYITFAGETLCVVDWAHRLGLSQSAFSHRISKHGAQRAIEMGDKLR